MKIILSAFGEKLMSGIMDVPEQTGHYFDMVLTQPLQAISGFDGTTIKENLPFETRCTFEYIGKHDWNTGARIYVLKEIRQ